MIAATRNSAPMVASVALIAFSKPISLVRCATVTSIMFMTRMPATARLIAAMPETPSVSAPSGWLHLSGFTWQVNLDAKFRHKNIKIII